MGANNRRFRKGGEQMMATLIEWIMLVVSAVGVYAAAKQFIERGANLDLWA
jgi:hypothetical protein